MEVFKLGVDFEALVKDGESVLKGLYWNLSPLLRRLPSVTEILAVQERTFEMIVCSGWSLGGTAIFELYLAIYARELSMTAGVVKRTSTL